MTDLNPAELLEKGAAYIEEHGLWQGNFWPDQGECISAVEAQRRGLPVCALGAIDVASGGMGDLDAEKALATHVGSTIPGWNDTPGRTAAEVADAMRACATELRGA